MKKFLLFLIGISFIRPPEIKANPIVYENPQAFISELFFTHEYIWHMEIELWVPEYYLIQGIIDSIVIESTAGRARWDGWYITPSELFLINRYNLTPMLLFSHDQDTIRIYTYLNPTLIISNDTVVVHTLIYGYPECEIPEVYQNNDGGWTQSICAREKQIGHPKYFYRDNSPTLALFNDLQGSQVTLTGDFFDYRDSLISSNTGDYLFSLPINSEYKRMDIYSYWEPLTCFQFNADGSYSTMALSRHTLSSEILRGYFHAYPGFVQDLTCVPFEYDLMPEEILHQDIHLTDTNFMVGFNKLPPPVPNDFRITVAPNPFIISTKIYLESDQTLCGKELLIIDIRGRTVSRFTLSDTEKDVITIEKQTLGRSGIYLYSFILNGKTLKTGQLICQ